MRSITKPFLRAVVRHNSFVLVFGSDTGNEMGKSFTRVQRPQTHDEVPPSYVRGYGELGCVSIRIVEFPQLGFVFGEGFEAHFLAAFIDFFRILERLEDEAAP